MGRARPPPNERPSRLEHRCLQQRGLLRLLLTLLNCFGQRHHGCQRDPRRARGVAPSSYTTCSASRSSEAGARGRSRGWLFGDEVQLESEPRLQAKDRTGSDWCMRAPMRLRCRSSRSLASLFSYLPSVKDLSIKPSNQQSLAYLDGPRGLSLLGWADFRAMSIGWCRIGVQMVSKWCRLPRSRGRSIRCARCALAASS
jgi:hypothetical protein